MKLWLNGAIRDAARARIAADDRGFTLGDGVFETLRVQAGRILRPDAHLRRLRDGAAVLGIPVRHGDESLLQAMAQTLAANGILDGSLRLTLSRGPAPRGTATPAMLRPTVLVSAAPTAVRPGPAAVVVAATTCRNERSVLSRIKSLNYLDSILARREAEQAGADDAILLNMSGRIAEATSANLIVLSRGMLLTPPVEDGALPGIARHALIEAGLVQIASLDMRSIEAADAILLCNSLGVRTVASLGGRSLIVRGDLQGLLEAALTPA